MQIIRLTVNLFAWASRGEETIALTLVCHTHPHIFGQREFPHPVVFPLPPLTRVDLENERHALSDDWGIPPLAEYQPLHLVFLGQQHERSALANRGLVYPPEAIPLVKGGRLRVSLECKTEQLVRPRYWESRVADTQPDAIDDAGTGPRVTEGQVYPRVSHEPAAFTRMDRRYPEI